MSLSTIALRFDPGIGVDFNALVIASKANRYLSIVFPVCNKFPIASSLI